jgi:hypothetical protein
MAGFFISGFIESISGLVKRNKFRKNELNLKSRSVGIFDISEKCPKYCTDKC